MTPKEKAKELIEKYRSISLLEKYNSKECALIAVNEILSEHFGDDSEYGTRRYYYFQEVKQEIESCKFNS